jgi:hypothetical protein
VNGGPAGRQPPGKETMTRRELLETMGTMAIVVAASPLIDGVPTFCLSQPDNARGCLST